MKNEWVSLSLVFLFFSILAVVFYISNHLNEKIFSGDGWKAKRFDDKYFVSVDSGRNLVDALNDFCNKRKIDVGSISGIGAVNNAVLRFFNPDTKNYSDKAFDKQMEIVNLTGNISSMNKKCYIHIHVTFADDKYVPVAGHLLSAVINGAGEFIITNIPNANLERKFSDELGLNIFNFKK